MSNFTRNVNQEDVNLDLYIAMPSLGEKSIKKKATNEIKKIVGLKEFFFYPACSDTWAGTRDTRSSVQRYVERLGYERMGVSAATSPLIDLARVQEKAPGDMAVSQCASFSLVRKVRDRSQNEHSSDHFILAKEVFL